jgi:tRNA 5-methylaminomethyl-2-thiouridine biosynthesis bifunctional protein
VIGAAPVLVLANALDAQRLLPASAGAWPQRAVRGQVSLLNSADPGAPRRPRVAVAGAGYLLPLQEGALLLGATSQEGDADSRTRETDHHHNLAQLAGLVGGDASAWRSLGWQGRVGWRAVTPDRLPLIGAVVDAAAVSGAAGAAGGARPRADRPRFVPRLRRTDSGLYVFTGLGSRGIGWAALGGQLLASWVAGSPSPLEADLREALDPARFALRP